MLISLEDQLADVERLVSLGASRYPWKYEPDAGYIVLADPHDNLLCVMSKNKSSGGIADAKTNELLYLMPTGSFGYHSTG